MNFTKLNQKKLQLLKGVLIEIPTLKAIHICNSHKPTAQSQNCKRV